MPDGQGWILFKMRAPGNALHRLSNPSPEPPRVKTAPIISRKQDGRLHGLGLNRSIPPPRGSTADSLPMDMTAACSQPA
ncbi:MAG: hypothetical protein ACLR0U_32125 [Enterocloster clostridioformis]